MLPIPLDNNNVIWWERWNNMGYWLDLAQLVFFFFQYITYLKLLQLFLSVYSKIWASLVAQTSKNLPAMQETWVRSLAWEDPLKKEMATHPRILAGESHGQRSLAGYRPWGRRRVGHDWVTHTFTLSQHSLKFKREKFPPKWKKQHDQVRNW